MDYYQVLILSAVHIFVLLLINKWVTAELRDFESEQRIFLFFICNHKKKYETYSNS